MPFRWKIYAFIYSALVLVNVIFNLHPAGAPYNYYQILIFLDNAHELKLILFYFANLMEMISLLPLFLFVFKGRFLSRDFWKVIFLFRVAGLLGGRNFEYNLIKSLLFANHFTTLLIVSAFVLIALPSFAAQYLYAFRKDGS
jgi:hypothetical protein